MDATIDRLQIDIEGSSATASSGIEALAKTLNTLRSSVKGGVGLTAVSNQLVKLNQTLIQCLLRPLIFCPIVSALETIEAKSERVISVHP